jgi:iron complex outermembrane receptor protein
MKSSLAPRVPFPAVAVFRRLSVWLMSAVFLCTLASAQETGVVTGKVLKPATGEFARFAEVRVDGSGLMAETDEEGFYRLSGVPAGEVTLVVSTPGYQDASSTVTVAAGQVATKNFEIQATGSTAKAKSLEEETVELEKYVVSVEAEGQAKSYRNQRRSMNIGEHVSSDECGEVAEGNVGEFLKHLPGIELEYVQFDARGPRIRGMDPQYVGVTLDGIKLASADAFNATVGSDNAGSEGSRAFGFESISLSSIDAVEVFKSLSADLDADAPAGTINLRSKRAFERQGQRIAYTLSANANSEEFHLRRTAGPGSDKTFKTRPSGSLEYSNTFFNNRLGIVANYNNSSIYNEFQQMAMSTTNRSTNATDTRVAVPQLITFTDGPKLTDRETYTFRADYKLSPQFSFGVNTTYGKYHAIFDNRQFRFVSHTNNNAAQRLTVIGDDPLVEFETGPTSATSISLLGGSVHKLTDTISILPSFDWKPSENLRIEGRFGWSESENVYHALDRGISNSVGVNGINNVRYTARRSDRMSADWTITQTGGPDWGDAGNYLNPRVYDEGRTDFNEVYTGALDLTWRKPLMGLPAYLKVGVRSREEYRKFTDTRNWNRYSYVGPGGGATGSFGFIPTTDPIEMSGLGTTFPSLSGRPPGFVDRGLAADLYNEHPEYFTPEAAARSADTYFASWIANNRNIVERVDAAYVLGNLKFKKLQIQPGVRFEKTTDALLQPTRRSRAEVIAAGYAVNGSTGRATTIPGLEYQWQTLEPTVRKTDYDHVFASAALKYSISEKFEFQAGYHEAISRPPLVVISGVTSYNDNNLLIVTPNPGLLPEESRNLSAKLTYLMPGLGTLSAGVFQINVDNLRVDFDRPPGTWFDEFPDIDPDLYAAYTVRSTVNSTVSRRFRGMELDYRQQLSFLPAAFSRSSVFANYTRNYADLRRGGLAPHQVNVGGALQYKRFRFGGSMKWTSDTPWTNVANSVRYRRERAVLDLNASYSFSPRLSLTLTGRDVGNKGLEIIEKRDGQPDELQQKDIYGTLWTLTMRGTF